MHTLTPDYSSCSRGTVIGLGVCFVLALSIEFEVWRLENEHVFEGGCWVGRRFRHRTSDIVRLDKHAPNTFRTRYGCGSMVSARSEQ